MRIPAGTKLGHYEILGLVGKGGMGEVYRANDTKLGRDVAIKLLPREFVNDEERLSRLQREARVLAQLNHPNIATLHALEAQDGERFLVMELVEGETLAERISAGRLRLAEALPLFIQLADGLEAAHEGGVVHRDLKPANVKIAAEGQVKILDFGLAKAGATSEPDEDTSQSPTRTRATADGVVLGTAPYMSPEQARGKPVDKRSDVWAYGCCLFEALTGRKAFEGDTVSDTLSLILQREPEWARVPEPMPANVTRVLHRCLDKDPRNRLRDIGEARIALGEPENEKVERAGRAWVGLASALAVGVLLGSLLDDSEPPERFAPTTRSEITLPTDAPLALNLQANLLGFDSLALALSPDGSSLVYAGRGEEGTRLYRRDMLAGTVEPIPGTEGGLHPFFSPDGESIGFLTTRQVKRVSLRGEAPITLAELDEIPTRGRWTRDDFLYVQSGAGIYSFARIGADGGEATEIDVLANAPPDTASVAIVSDVLSDGRAALFTAVSGVSADFAQVQLLHLDSMETRVLIERGYDAKYVESGHLVFARSGNLMAASFDLERLEVTGEPRIVVTGVKMDSFFVQSQWAVSETGTLVYAAGGDDSVGKFAWVDRQGRTEYLPVPERLYGAVDLSPDDRRLAVQVADFTDHIWIYDFAREEGSRLAAEGSAYWPLWTPDGKSVTYSDGRPGRLVVQDVEDPTARTELPGPPGRDPTAWSLDGALVARNRSGVGVEFLSHTGEKAPPSFGGANGDFSPDGRWMVYGQGGVVVRSWPQGNTVRLVSPDRPIEPRWCRQCDEIFYRRGNQWMSVRVSLTPELSWEPPQVAFESDIIGTDGISYDVSADGGRLLVVKRASPEVDRTSLQLVVNWFDLLERSEAQ